MPQTISRFSLLLIVPLFAACLPDNPETAGDSDVASSGTTSSSSTAPPATTHSPETTTTTEQTTDHTTDQSSTTPEPSCGDGHVDPGEQCDLAEQNADNGDCTSTCQHAVCGDGLVRDAPQNPGDAESCDLGDANDGAYGGCTPDCTLAPYCGDGTIEPDHEVCEPGDSELPCTSKCTYAGRLIFVTSATYDGALQMFDLPGMSDGLRGADTLCRAHAEAAGLPHHESFLAWLSTSDQPAPTRIAADLNFPEQPLQLVDGTLVAQSWSHLLETDLLHPINLTEQAESFASVVWTGTLFGGSPASDCALWTSNGLFEAGMRGDSEKANSQWTEKGLTGCNAMAALYCIQATIDPPPDET